MPNAGKPRDHKLKWFLNTAVLITSAVAVFLFPDPGAHGLVLLKQVVGPSRGLGQVAIIGNSVVRHVSKCDKDRRTIPEMVGDLTGHRVLDLSGPGQSMAETLNYAGL